MLHCDITLDSSTWNYPMIVVANYVVCIGNWYISAVHNVLSTGSCHLPVWPEDRYHSKMYITSVNKLFSFTIFAKNKNEMYSITTHIFDTLYNSTKNYNNTARKQSCSI